MQGVELARIAVSGFLAVVFLHGGLDKVLDRRGNVRRLKVAFDATPMQRAVRAWLTLLTLGEVAAGVTTAAGCLSLLASGGHSGWLALAGVALGALCVTWQYFGLKLGRDSAAAASTVPYFVTCLAGLVLLG
jgi:uncharacterized membrane protein YphA (DoxX/SURF4 family)